MRRIWVLAVGLALLSGGLFLPGTAQAQFKLSLKSIHCDVTLATGGNPETDDYVTCAVNIKEITGVCKNPADGSAVLSSGQPFTVRAFVQAASTGSWTKTENGKYQQDIVISNQMIQQALDIYNAQNGLPFVFLKATNALCKRGWISHGWAVTKIDGTLANSKVPSLQDADRTVIASGSASYFNKTVSPTVVTIPTWNWIWDNPDDDYTTPDGEKCGSETPDLDCTGTQTGTTDVFVFPFNGDMVNGKPSGDPFMYCSRFTDATVSPSGRLADSGLRIYDYTCNGLESSVCDPVAHPELVPLVDNTLGRELLVSDATYKVKNCYLWRDVNKDPAFDMSAFGIYDPDVANIIPPQTGNPQQKVKGQLTSVPDDKLGGFVLRSVSADPSVTNYYTGECHQHGKETNGGGNYAWNQQGPAKNLPDGTIRDAMCQGNSQLMDGTYDDYILP